MTTITAPGDDLEPVLVKGDTVWLAAGVIVIVLGLSITTNTYTDLHGKSVIPWGIPLAFGIAIPILVAVVSHTAARLNVRWGFRVVVAAPAVAFMVYSAHAGIQTLGPEIGTGWAVVIAVSVDTTAVIFLGILMFADEQHRRHTAWQQREKRRAEKAALEELKARQGRRPAPRVTAEVTPAGNSGGNAGGSNPGNSSGGEATDPGSGATVTDIATRRPSQTLGEIRELAREMAAVLAAAGTEITVRMYTDRYGGKPARVGPVIAEVKAEFAGQVTAARQQAAATAATGSR